jgi:hypothetical protein
VLVRAHPLIAVRLIAATTKVITPRDAGIARFA